MGLLDIPIHSIILFSNAVGVAYPVALYTGRDTTELSHQVENSGSNFDEDSDGIVEF